MIRLIDSHAHLYVEEFKSDISEVVSRALEAGIEKIFMPNIDHSTIDDMLELEQKYPGFCIPMMGLHPCSVKKNFEKELYIVEEWLDKRPFSAVGEMGTDLYWDKTFFDQQKEAFNIQCELALKHNLPIVVHCRESIDETTDLVIPYADKGLKGVFHCFTGTVDQAKKLVGHGLFLGIGGVATFKNGGLGPVLEEIAPDHLLLETDSPYLAPAPNRGKRNEPAFVRLVAEKIAEITAVGIEKIGEITTANAIQLFRGE